MFSRRPAMAVTGDLTESPVFLNASNATHLATQMSARCCGPAIFVRAVFAVPASDDQ